MFWCYVKNQLENIIIYHLRGVVAWYTFLQNFVDLCRFIPKFYDTNLLIMKQPWRYANNIVDVVH